MHTRYLLLALVIFALFLQVQSLLAQAPDNRIWPKNTKQVSLIEHTWIEVPRNTSHSGAAVVWPAVQGFKPNINALFERFSGNIREYRAASLPLIKIMGMKILRDRVIYNRIWEIESTAGDLRYFQRAFLTEDGAVVVTSTAKNKNWNHKSVGEMINAMRTVDVLW
jgi:hypothetical protein